MRRLGPNVRLESNGGAPVLRYLPQPGAADLPPLPIHPLLALVLAHCDRQENSEPIAARLAERLSAPVESIKEIVDDARITFRAHFKNDNGASFVDLGDLDAYADSLGAPGAVYRSRDVVFPHDRAPFPLTLQWLVTRYCNRHCIYCYAAPMAGAKAKDAEISRTRMREIIGEAARLGAHTFFLTGGEPLLRDDAYELIADALSFDLKIELITKQFIPDDAAARLAEGGLKRIYLSIDSLDALLARKMTGVHHFAREMSRTIERLVARGIEVYAKCVLTRENIEAVPVTVGLLDELGVRWVGLVRYCRTHDQENDSLMPSREQLLRLSDWSEAFSAQAGHGIKVSFSYHPDTPPPADLGPDRFVCHNGTTSLLVRPDGCVSRCDKRLPGGDVVVGDLRTHSVHQVWNSPAMLDSMKPPRALYAGTLCHDCAQFDVCHERGRCYYDAYLTSGTLYGPQGNCPYVDTRGAMGC